VSTSTALRFRARCPSCGYVELAATQLRLVVADRPGGSFYAFRCPDCGAAVRWRAGQRVVELLTDGGVLSVRVHGS
jgi:predicted RNA-binding Zn-ribbon protein involved in translation (DUF1610 family)